MPNTRQKKPSRKKRPHQSSRTIAPALHSAPWPVPDPFLKLPALSRAASIGTRTLRDYINRPVDPLPAYRPGASIPRLGQNGARGSGILVRWSEFCTWMEKHRERQVPPARDVGGILEQAKREVMGR